MKITPKNWADFQHYKDRDPPWIKLHKKLLDDFEYQSLPLASRALAPMLWLLASEDKEGVINANDVKLAFRLRITVGELTDALMPLIQSNFFSVQRDASEMIAPCEPDAMPETEAQGKAEAQPKTETLPDKSGGARGDDPEFEEFWKAYKPPPNSKKPDTRKAWAATAKVRPPLADHLRAVANYQSWLVEEGRKQKREYPKQHPATWLRGEVWGGFMPTGAEATPDELAAVRDRRDRLMKQGKYDPQFGSVAA